MANVVSMKQLLEAGVHFGHPTRKWNPKMKKYIYTSRNDIYIINLEKTVGLIDDAYAFIKSVAESEKNILSALRILPAYLLIKRMLRLQTGGQYHRL